MTIETPTRPQISGLNGRAGYHSPPSRYLTYDREGKRKVNWPRVFAYLRFIVWALVSKTVLGIVYCSVIREGLAFLIPALGQKLSRIPGLSFLANYEATHKLDLAFVMAIFFLIAVLALWHKVLALWLYGHVGDDDGEHTTYRHRREYLYAILAIVIILVDSCIFYFAMTQNGWGNSMFSISALLATIGYLIVLLFLTLSTIQLQQNIRNY